MSRLINVLVRRVDPGILIALTTGQRFFFAWLRRSKSLLLSSSLVIADVSFQAVAG